jgi:hypothetical protein
VTLRNSPPEIAFSLEVDDLFALLSDTLAGTDGVTTDEQEAAIDGLMDDFRRVAKDTEASRKEAAKPFDDGKKAVQAAFKPVLDKAESGIAACKDALTPYRDAKRRAAEEAARKLREEAEERQRQAQAALHQSDDLAARWAAEETLKAADKLAKEANRVDRAPTGLRTYYEAVITDRKAALLHYIARSPERFEALIQQLADEDARGTRAPVPGIDFIERKRAA